ncbi:DHA2 family efflux MFS transporter permease subunit [Verrucomicrobium sp. GAS474]|uniref:DHA2 family efflux MFS transporter permease subunit n=1 Tax=Verrucomicrobium sp. GAS474 TaxID=1882831 RepID=UPI0018D425EF|nr:DHA2 family efflux MFS transporter permease subunit [Verrucomicrobium sp. GAS474]
MSAAPSSVIASMSDRRKLTLFALMAIGQFMALLDTQIVAASISDIQAGLAAAPDESSWIQTAYLIGEIVMIPLSGWLSRAFSTRWLFTASAAAFTLSSVLCGFAWSIHSMIAARALQGFVGGAMIPTVFATGFALFEGKKRALIPATLGLLSSLAPTLGPTLGGWITDTLSWRWLFFVNIVPGLVITFTIPFFEAIDEPEPSLLKKFDLIGLLLLALFLGSLQYVLEEGYRWNWLDDGTIRAWAAVSLVSGVAFVWRSLRHPSPIVDFRALKSRTFAVASLFIFVTGFGLFGGIYVLPLFLARVAGFDARQIGEAVFVAGLSQILIAPLVARLSQRADPRAMLAAGFLLFALGLWMTTYVTPQWQSGEFFWPQIVRGLAILLCIVPATNMALGSLAPAHLKMGSALFNTMRNLGGAIGIACINTWINDRTNLHWHRLAENLRAGDPKVQTSLQGIADRIGTTPGDPHTLAILARTVRQQAVTMAFADVFWLIAVLFFGALILIPLLKRTQAPSAEAAKEAH